MRRVILFLFFFPTLLIEAQSGWDTVGVHGFGMVISTPFVQVSPDGTPYMALRSGQGISVWKFDGQAWIHVGPVKISTGDGNQVTMTFDKYGTPYVSYQDWSDNYKATVLKYDGTNWHPVGNSCFSPGATSCNSIALDSHGTPYVAFRDLQYAYKASVMKFDGNNWVYLGSPGFSTPGGSADGAVYTTITFDKNDVPYVAYSDMANNYRATVQKFDGTNWIYVGAHGFANWNTENSRSMVFDKNNIPYIVVSVANKARVMKFEGSNWTILGDAISQGYSEYASIAIDTSDNLFVAFTDYVNGEKATVKKYNGSSWEVIGDSCFSAAQAYNTTMDVDKNGNAYIGFSDCSTHNCWWATVMKHSYTTSDLQEEEKQNSFNIYPNPTGGKVTILYSGAINNISVNVRNQLGQIITSKYFSNTNTLNETFDLTGKSKGIYLVEIISNHGKETRKIIIE